MTLPAGTPAPEDFIKLHSNIECLRLFVEGEQEDVLNWRLDNYRGNLWPSAMEFYQFMVQEMAMVPNHLQPLHYKSKKMVAGVPAIVAIVPAEVE
jgi:hypothetical protein